MGIQDTFSRPHLICQYLTLLTAGIFSSQNALFLFWAHPALVFLHFLDCSCLGPFPHSDCLTGWWTWEFFKVACLPFSSLCVDSRPYLHPWLYAFDLLSPSLSISPHCCRVLLQVTLASPWILWEYFHSFTFLLCLTSELKA